MSETPEKLLAEADRSAELLISAVRLAIAACLGVLVIFTTRRSDLDFTTTYAVIAIYAVFAVVAMAISRSRFFSSTTPFFLIAIEGVIIAVGLYVGLSASHASPGWVMAPPAAIWAIIALALQSLRYRIELQAFASVVILGAFFFIALLPAPQAPPDGAAFVSGAFGPVANGVRFALLGLLALALTVSVWRSRELLKRIRREVEASLGLARFLPKEIRARASGAALEELRRGRAIKAAILFIDVRGFTKMSEAVGARRISEFLTAYRGVVTRVVERHGGVVDKFVGDGALIFFGDQDEPREAAAKALKAVVDLSETLICEVSRPAPLGPEQPPYVVVAHFGDVLVGAFGEDDRLEFTIIGSPVNETARLEAVAKQHDAAIAVSAAMFEAAGEIANASLWRDLGEIELRGAEMPQRVYQWISDGVKEQRS